MSTPRQIAARLRAVRERIPDLMRDELRATGREVVETTRTQTHVITGALQGSITVVEDPAGGRVVSVRVAPQGIPYAEAEAGKGGAHSFAERGFAASTSRFDQAANNLERAIERAIENG